MYRDPDLMLAIGVVYVNRFFSRMSEFTNINHVQARLLRDRRMAMY